MRIEEMYLYRRINDSRKEEKGSDDYRNFKSKL